MPTPTTPSSCGSIIVISFPFLLPLYNQWTTEVLHKPQSYLRDIHFSAPLSHNICPSSPVTRQSITGSTGTGLALQHRRISGQFLSACLECLDTYPLLSCGQRP